jgi:hypothetical protein
MARQDIDIGVEGNDNTGDSIRESFRKVNENFSELYAVFGIGGQISFTDLSDVPDTYEGNENKVPLVRATATGMDFVTLASDSALDPADVDTIGFDFSVDGKLVVRIVTTRIQNDPTPVLGGPLNAGTQVIGNTGDLTQDNVDVFNSVHGTNITVDDLVITKGYADVNFQPREKAGAGLRLDPEPADRSQYSKVIDSFNLGNAVILGHNYGEEYNSAPFTFTVSDGGTPPTNIVAGETYYIRIVDADTVSLHETPTGALENTDRIIMSGGSGTLTITDNDFDPTLTGNWLSTVAIPRESAVRRQGDILEGAIFAHDHPGDLSGINTGLQEDLQLATKYYVDKQGIPPSQVNLYVSTSGDDRQVNTPAGKEGRSEPWAYRTINAAARKAEEIIAAAPYQAGPYQQTMTFGDGRGFSTVTTAGTTAPVSGRNNARTLVLENKEFIQKEVIGFVNTTFPDFEYDTEICERDVGFILDAVSLDIQLGDNANFLSRTAGIRYYENPSARKAIGEQKTETVAAIEHAKKLVNDILNQREIAVDPTALVDVLYQDRYTQYIEPLQQPDANADNAADAKFDIILDIIEVGPLDAPPVVDGSVRYTMNVNNGNFGFIDQGDPTNQDIIPGKVVVGKNSGAKGRIISYKYESDPTTVTPASNDQFELQLLEPIEFETGEELEYGNFVKETQITIRIESGIYEEDLPIRVAENVSVKGDEFRRVIVRPKDRVSQSRYSETFFYRDAEFDGLVIVASRLKAFTLTNAYPDATRAAAAGTYNNVATTSSKYGTGATFDITIAANGSVSATLNQPGTDYLVNDVIELDDLLIGASGADDLRFTVDEITGGKKYVDPITGEIAGYFGFHYLRNPDKPKNVGPGYQNAGGYTTAAAILRDNKEFFQEQVVEYINTEWPAVVYSPTKCARDVGLIIEALAEDLEVGSNEFTLQAQGEYYYGALPVDGSQSEATEDGINHIYTIIESIFNNAQPTTYGVSLDYPQADLFNGTAENGAQSIAQNLVGTITFAFNADYNPPLRNDEIDVFLMNNATILRNITGQGHGGFQMVLDPEGQVLTKSPYCQTGTGFAGSLNKQAFRGGLLVDAFTGNTAMRVTGRRDGDPFVLEVESLGSQDDPQGLFVRRPEVPAPFYIDGRRFQVNAVTEYDPDFGTAVLLLDKNSNDGAGFTGTTSNLLSGIDLDTVGTFDFDVEKCERDSNIILTGARFDIALGTTYNQITNGLAYQRATSAYLQSEQQTQTVQSINKGKTEVLALDGIVADGTATTRATDYFDEVIDIIENGVVSTDTAADLPVSFPAPAVLPTADADDAATRLINNRAFLAAEVVAFVNDNTPPAGYDQTKCGRDVEYIVDAFTYDILYGGNYGTSVAAKSYFDGAVEQLPLAQRASTIAAYQHLESVINDLLVGTPVTPTTGNALSPNTSGANATATETARISTFIDTIIDVIDIGTTATMPPLEYPNLGDLGVSATLTTASDDIENNQDLIVHRMIQIVDSPIPITMQTAGNRSMLGNDFTQINDLGYGLVVVNGALSEMVSMFTYYCRASYYSKNGSEIRSLTGSSCYGEFGLVAEGSDPNEIPDGISLGADMARPAKAFTAEIVLTTTGDLTLAAGRDLEQAGSGATGTTTMAIDGRTVYIVGVTGIWDTTNQITDVTGGGSIALGANSIPTEVDSTGYTNDKEQLNAYIYDIEEPPSNRGEFDIYHPITDIFARYEIANVEVTDLVVGTYKDFAQSGGAYTTTYTAINLGLGTGASFNIVKTVEGGYDVQLIQIGTDYEVGDQITFLGTDLGGASPANDVSITVDAIDSNGGIADFTQGAATIAVNGDTPVKDGQVYKVNFSTGDAQFSQDGILETDGIVHGTFCQVRNNQTFILTDIARPDILTIRPSTAVIFRENPGTVYRSISFLTADATGETLPEDNSLAGFDSTYDYVRLVTDSTTAQENIGSVYGLDGITALSGGTTMGNTAGDTTIAVTRIFEENEIRRLNNNTATPENFRPSDYTGELPMVMSWSGKKHTVFNYRGVKTVDVTETLSNATQTNPVVITLSSDINLVNGEQISFTGVGGMTELNAGTYYVNNVSGAQAELYDDAGLSTSTDGTGFTAYTTGGTAAIPRQVVQQFPGETDEFGIIDIADKDDINYPATATGLASTVVLGNENVILRTGLQEGSPGTVTINISTCRATGHDFLDVGTGGFNTSNYPNVIFGLPQAPDQSKEVDERGKGRVFYVSTDQNGIFRVGRFFSVDQGTGTVSFSASIALSDVDGLGFKRGVVVTEFSTDTAMTDNASDTVPTESAVRGYVNRRLGFDQTGAAITNKIGPGVLAPNGAVPMTDNLNAASNTITNLRAPLSDSDAATKAYVDATAGGIDTIPDFRDTEINGYDEGQLLVSTGLKRIILDADTIVSGPFEVGDTITGSISGAEGTVVDVESTTGLEGNIIVITYTAVSGTFSSGPPLGQDTVEVLGGAEAVAIDGPIDEWGNGIWTGSGDIETSVTRNVTYDAILQEVTDRSVSLELNIKPDVIVNADVNSAAAIAQSKLNMQAASTLADATSGSGALGAVIQADLGLVAFKASEFTLTDGFAELKTATDTATGVGLDKITHIAEATVLGRAGAGAGEVTAVPFSDISNLGGAIVHNDLNFTDIDGIEDAFSDTGAGANNAEPGVLTRTGDETYSVLPITTTGAGNSFVKTDADGSIQVNSLILGGDSNYEILALDTTELIFKTPAQGEILRAVGGGVGTPPDVSIGGSIDVGGTGITQSTLHTASNYNGESALGVDWIYSGFIEAPGEKGSASTGIAIGADTGLTTAGQVAIAVADSLTSSTFTPFVFSSTGAIPDQDNVYNIGNSSRRYNTIYASVFNGTATEAFYADLAENYLGDEKYEAGTVLVFGGANEVTTTDVKGDTRVAGVVSENPAHLMNSMLVGDTVVPLALQGRVPVKVIGKVSKGDMLVTSAIPGYAVASHDPKVGQVIGKALKSKEGSDKGVVEAVVGRV